MGTKRRPQPERLAEKLRLIRIRLGLTQEEMVKRLNYRKSPLYPSQISLFEQGKREPPVLVLLQYARVISTTGRGELLEAILDDEMELPDSLPSDPSKVMRSKPYDRKGKT